MFNGRDGKGEEKERSTATVSFILNSFISIVFFKADLPRLLLLGMPMLGIY